MKTKNNLITGILIGISVIVLPLILMGTISPSNISDGEGAYQISTSYGNISNGTSPHIFETIIDTRSGKVISRDRRSALYYW